MNTLKNVTLLLSVAGTFKIQLNLGQTVLYIRRTAEKYMEAEGVLSVWGTFAAGTFANHLVSALYCT